VAPFLGLDIRNERAVSSLTRGLVGDTSFAVLPEVSSRMTFVITLISLLVSFNSMNIDSSFQCAKCCGNQPTACSLQASLLAVLRAFCLDITSMRRLCSLFLFLSRTQCCSSANDQIADGPSKALSPLTKNYHGVGMRRSPAFTIYTARYITLFLFLTERKYPQDYIYGVVFPNFISIPRENWYN
jgi:ALG6, ALG8 glycosyltransferase family